VADIYLALRTRIEDIVVNGRGTSTHPINAEALAKSIPIGRFRNAVKNAPLDDRDFPAGSFDRSIRLDWLSIEDDNGGVNNPLDDPHYYLARASVSTAVVYGPEMAPFVDPTNTELAVNSVVEAQERIFGDVHRIARALACPDLIRDPSDTDPVPLSCVREGLTTARDIGGGRMISQTVYSFRFQTNNADDNDP
jgi:hypothetical protein